MKRTVKRLTAFMLVVLVVISGMSSEMVSAATARATTMKLDSYTGTVTVHTMNGTSRKASKGMRLLNGYEVGTSAAGNAYINLDDAKAVKMDEKTKVQVRQQGKQLELMTKSGNIFFNVKKPLEADESFRIRSSTLVTGVRGTSAYLSVDKEKTSVFLLEGTLELKETAPDTGEVNTVIINGGEVAVSYKYASDKVDVQTEAFTESDVPYFVLEEIAKDADLQKNIDEKSTLSSEKLVKMKEYMDQGMTQEDAAAKAEADVNNTDSNNSNSNNSNSNTNVSGGGSISVGGGSWSPSEPVVSGNTTPDGTVSGNTTVGVIYQVDERFADGYPKLTRDSEQNTVTVTYKLKEGVASEANPAKIYDVLTSYNTGTDTTTEAVLHGHLGRTTQESHIPIISADECNFFSITDTNEYSATYNYSRYRKVELYSVIDCNGVTSETPAKVGLEKETYTESTNPGDSNTGTPGDSNTNTVISIHPQLYINQTRDVIYMYFYEALDEKYIPNVESFEIYQNSQVTDTQVTKIDIKENIQDDTSYYRRSCVTLTLSSSLSEIEGTSSYIGELRCSDTDNIFRSVEGNKMPTNSWFSIRKALTTVEDAGISADGHYIGFKAPISIMRTFSSNESYWNQLAVKVDGQVLDTEKYEMGWSDSWVSVRICDPAVSMKPKTVEIYAIDGRKLYNILGEEMTNLIVTEFKEDPEITFSSASYNEQNGTIKVSFEVKGDELKNSYGLSACNFALKIGETEYRLRGDTYYSSEYSSADGTTDWRYVINFRESNLKHVDFSNISSMQVKYDPIGVKEGLDMYSGFIFNNSEKPLEASEYINVTIEE